MKSNIAKGLIELENLRMTFGNQVVLDRINLAVPKGESLVVLGRSGSGKSVLLKLIIALLRPSEGGIRIGGEEITRLKEDRLGDIRKRIGFLFQQGALYDSLTVKENVAFPLRRHTRMTGSEIDERALDLLASVGMEKDNAKMPSEISGGMQKRVGLARALALEPEIMLLDEPTAGLDPITAGEINDLIGRLQDRRFITAVIVTHDMWTARAVSTQAAVLENGRIVMEGAFEDLERSELPLISKFMTHSFAGGYHYA